MALANGIEMFGISMNSLSIGMVPFLSVFHAIASQDLHSGTRMFPIFLHRHSTLVNSFKIFMVALMEANRFGTVNGGGRSGSLMSGRLGSSGRFGSSGSLGSIGI